MKNLIFLYLLTNGYLTQPLPPWFLVLPTSWLCQPVLMNCIGCHPTNCWSDFWSNGISFHGNHKTRTQSGHLQHPYLNVYWRNRSSGLLLHYSIHQMILVSYVFCCSFDIYYTDIPVYLYQWYLYLFLYNIIIWIDRSTNHLNSNSQISGLIVSKVLSNHWIQKGIS